MKTNMKNKASSLRDSAEEQYRHVRENPRASAVEGAKSFGSMLKQYGPVFVGTYMGVYFTTLGLLFAGVESGVMDPVSLFDWLGHGGSGGEGVGETKSTVELVVQFMESHALTKPYAPVVQRNPEFANLAAAWVAVKFTEPVRFPVAVAITPRIARYFGYAAAVAEPRIDSSSEEAADDGSSSSKTTTEEDNKDNEKDQATSKS